MNIGGIGLKGRVPQTMDIAVPQSMSIVSDETGALSSQMTGVRSCVGTSEYKQRDTDSIGNKCIVIKVSNKC